MKVIKRSGAESKFDVKKIISAITRANESVEIDQRISEEEILRISNEVVAQCKKMKRALSVEEIQDLVEDHLMSEGTHELARKYITYRYNRALVRKANTTDAQILSLIECNNEEVKQEN